jgi:4-diphosphocytidyl-2-C-methyl-D-erythritol kinase
MTVTLETCAKVNLYLHVCGRRPNGYHELDSLIVFAKTGDVLTFEDADVLSLDVTGPMAGDLDGDADDNLVLKAARGLRDLCGLDKGAKISLDKRLPVAAGIGGGSGDAATALKGLCQLWKVFPDPQGLEELALSLGADVPTCLKEHANHVGGIGEVITPLAPLPQCWMVLVNPMKALSTPAVFKARTGGFTRAAPMVGEYESLGVLIGELEQRRNDLSDPAIARVPDIRDVLDEIEQQSGCLLSRMSGSGATCFGLFATEEAAIKAEKALKTAQTGWWVARGKII